MKRSYAFFTFASLLTVSMLVPMRLAAAASLITGDQAAQAVVVRNVIVKDGDVSGEIVNSTSRPVRDVELLIRYGWRWKNEFRPGKDDPSTSFEHTVNKEIPPGAAASFTFRPPVPLPLRDDGSFETKVSVIGFTGIIR